MKKYVLVMQHDETDCGAACLASVAKLYGKRVSVSRIRYFSGTDSMGTSNSERCRSSGVKLPWNAEQ